MRGAVRVPDHCAAVEVGVHVVAHDLAGVVDVGGLGAAAIGHRQHAEDSGVPAPASAQNSTAARADGSRRGGKRVGNRLMDVLVRRSGMLAKGRKSANASRSACKSVYRPCTQQARHAQRRLATTSRTLRCPASRRARSSAALAAASRPRALYTSASPMPRGRPGRPRSDAAIDRDGLVEALRGDQLAHVGQADADHRLPRAAALHRLGVAAQRGRAIAAGGRLLGFGQGSAARPFRCRDRRHSTPAGGRSRPRRRRAGRPCRRGADAQQAGLRVLLAVARLQFRVIAAAASSLASRRLAARQRVICADSTSPSACASASARASLPSRRPASSASAASSRPAAACAAARAKRYCQRWRGLPPRRPRRRNARCRPARRRGRAAAVAPRPSRSRWRRAPRWRCGAAAARARCAASAARPPAARAASR